MSGSDRLLELAVLVALVLAGALHVLAAAGHFPGEHRADALNSKLGRAVLFGSMAVMAVCLSAGIIAALRLIAWPAAVIGAGLGILAGPVLLRLLPDRFVDGPGALVAFTSAAMLLSAFLSWTAFF
jgi:hypothetical protein